MIKNAMIDAAIKVLQRLQLIQLRKGRMIAAKRLALAQRATAAGHAGWDEREKAVHDRLIIYDAKIADLVNQ